MPSWSATLGSTSRSSSTHDTGSGANAAPDLQANMDAYSHEQRYREIVNDCMRGRGYVLPQN